MTFAGKTLSEYLHFAKIFMALIFVVGALRLALSLGGVPNETTRFLSMTVLVWAGGLYAATRIHTSGFGSYKQLLPVIFLMNFTAQVVSMTAILIAIFTGTDNVFSAPEFAFGGDGKTWAHFLAHLFIGTTAGTLIGWLVGSFVMFVTKRLARRPDGAASAGA